MVVNEDLAQDTTETSFGICAYRSPNIPGFSAVLKGRFSDFIVHEVGPDGDKAELTSLDETILNGDESQDLAQADRKRKRADGSAEADANSPTQGTKVEKPVSMDWDALQLELRDLLHSQLNESEGDEYATNVITFLQKDPHPSLKYVCIPSSSDKQHRRTLHEWIRAKVSTHAVADTAEEEGKKVIRIWHVHFATDMPNHGKFDRSNRRPRPPAKFLRFVMYKENLDTNSALNVIQRKCGWGGGGRGGGRGGRMRQHSLRLGFAGMKDKRGVTTQFVTMPARSSVKNLIRAVNSRESNCDNGQVGGGHTDSGGVSVLRIGSFVYTDEDLRLGRLLGNRFDVVLRNVVVPNDSDRATTKETLKQAAESMGTAGFINYFGVQRFGKYGDTHLVGIAMLKKDFAKAVDIIMQPKPDERENTSLARMDWKERFSQLPDGAPDTAKAEAEQACAKRIVKEFGRFMNNEIAILRSLALYPLDYKRAISSVTKTMRMMFVHALQSLLFNNAATFRIQQLGNEVVEGDLVPDGPCDVLSPGIPSLRKATAPDVEQKRYTLEDVFLPLVGTKTMEPDSKTARIYTMLLQNYGLTHESFDHKDRDLNCAGDYRRLLIRPSDVDFAIIEYSNPRQPLVQTDMMKLQGIEINTAAPDSKSSLLAMRIGFTLPSSAYATIALRELMKRPTSSDYQKDLSMES